MLATSPRETLINIDAKVISHRRQVTFQLTEVAVSHQTLADILMLIPLVQPDDLAANGDNRHRISLRTALMKRIGTFMRPLTMPKAAEPWSLTSLRDKLIGMGTKVVSHGRNATIQMAEVGVRSTFTEILLLITRTRAHPHKHDGDCGRQMRQTMTAEVRVEGKSINPGTARRPTDRFGRQRPIRLTLVASAAHDFHHGGECQAAGFRPAHQPRDHFLEAQKMVGLPATGQYEM